jgi:hypothetical protein
LSSETSDWVRVVVAGNRDHAHLLGREPHREGAGEVLDQDRDEPFERPGHGAMNHDRPMRRVVLAGIRELEALRRIVVQLDRPELPGPSDAVRDVEVDLRPIERPVTFFQLVRAPRRLQRRPNAASARSQPVAADPLLRARGELERAVSPKAS